MQDSRKTIFLIDFLKFSRYNLINDIESDIMLISESIKEKNILLDLKGNSKKEILEELVSLLDEEKIIDKEKFLQDVYKREDAGSTALEYGLAIPHVRSEYIKEFSLAIAVKKDGIDFESLDEQKTKLFVFIATPMKCSSLHLEVLAKIAKILYSEVNVNMCVNATTKEELIKTISELERVN